MALLPRFFVMQATSQGAYLSVQEYPPSNRPLRFEERQIFSPRVKFTVENSATGDGTLVHIRSCYNNKYWMVHNIQGRLWIGASAERPQEDGANPACTLFRPTTQSGTQGFRFSSIARPNMNVVSTDGGLALMRGSATLFSTVDWETLVKLPCHVAFRSKELDDNYLCSRVIDRHYNYHRFEYGLDVADPLVAHELFPTTDGNYRIKDMHFGKFWRRSPNWIWADAEDANNSNDTLFSFVKIRDGVFALRNLGNNNFCGGLTTEGKKNCLNARYPNMSKETKLMVEECIMEREITDVRYRLFHSRIYQEEIQEVSHAFATNDSLDKETTVTLSYSSTDSRTSNWTNSMSYSFGVNVKFEISLVPTIAKGEIEVSAEYGYTREWGVAKTTERKREVSYAVVVPPSTTMKVTLMCTRAACDVPFSYTQRDLLTSGNWVTTVKDDGTYTGINTYNFYIRSSKVESFF